MICLSIYQSVNEASKIDLKVRQSCLGLNLTPLHISGTILSKLCGFYELHVSQLYNQDGNALLVMLLSGLTELADAKHGGCVSGTQ